MSKIIMHDTETCRISINVDNVNGGRNPARAFPSVHILQVVPMGRVRNLYHGTIWTLYPFPSAILLPRFSSLHETRKTRKQKGRWATDTESGLCSDTSFSPDPWDDLENLNGKFQLHDTGIV